MLYLLQALKNIIFYISCFLQQKCYLYEEENHLSHHLPLILRIDLRALCALDKDSMIKLYLHPYFVFIVVKYVYNGLSSHVKYIIHHFPFLEFYHHKHKLNLLNNKSLFLPLPSLWQSLFSVSEFPCSRLPTGNKAILCFSICGSICLPCHLFCC